MHSLTHPPIICKAIEPVVSRRDNSHMTPSAQKYYTQKNISLAQEDAEDFVQYITRRSHNDTAPTPLLLLPSPLLSPLLPFHSRHPLPFKRIHNPLTWPDIRNVSQCGTGSLLHTWNGTVSGVLSSVRSRSRVRAEAAACWGIARCGLRQGPF